MFAIALVLLGACQLTTPTKLSAMQQRQTAVDRMADRCAMPRTSLKLISDDQLAFQAGAGATNQAFDCFLAELEKSHLPVKLGFVGHEAYSEESK